MPTPAEAAHQLVSTPEGRQKAAALLLGLETIAFQIGWKICPQCHDWIYPGHPCRCQIAAQCRRTAPRGEDPVS